MRRNDREITNTDELLAILQRGLVCSLACMDGAKLYSVPLNYGVGYDESGFTLYFHSGNTGTKLELLRQNAQAAFTILGEHSLLVSQHPCDFSMAYESVCGVGTVRFLTGSEKETGLQTIMLHYAPDQTFSLPPQALEAVTVFALHVEQISGKKH